MASYLYEKYRIADETRDNHSDYQIVSQFLLGGQKRDKAGMPVIWVHVSGDINARWWPSFGSRNTRRLNQPYEHLTVASIVAACRDDFAVCVVKDCDFPKLVKGWTTNLETVPEPIRSNMRKLALGKLLHQHGGLLVPSSFLALRSLRPIYDLAGTSPGGMVACETHPEDGHGPPGPRPPRARQHSPRTAMMGCVQGSPAMMGYVTLMERIMATDCTAESAFLGEEAAWCGRAAGEGAIATVPAELLGVVDSHGKPVGVERLIGSSYIPISPSALGIAVPAANLRRRLGAGWFVRQSPAQVLGSDTALGKYILAATAGLG